MTKWEYCVLVGAYGRPQTSYPGLYRMTPNGKQPMANFKNRPKDVDEDQVVAQMLFQLGEDG